MSEFDQLYREVILDHYKNPRGHGVLDPADAHAEGQNPLCGDEVSIFVVFGEDGDTIDEVKRIVFDATYLVPQGSPVHDVVDIDREGVRLAIAGKSAGGLAALEAEARRPVCESAQCRGRTAAGRYEPRAGEAARHRLPRRPLPHPHRLRPEWARMDPRGDRADQPAPGPGRVRRVGRLPDQPIAEQPDRPGPLRSRGRVICSGPHRRATSSIVVVSPVGDGDDRAQPVRQADGPAWPGGRRLLRARTRHRGQPGRLADVERLYLDRLMQTRDANEGLVAFLAKRQPRWEHR